jgi:hypothetical protein
VRYGIGSNLIISNLKNMDKRENLRMLARKKKRENKQENGNSGAKGPGARALFSTRGGWDVRAEGSVNGYCF